MLIKELHKDVERYLQCDCYCPHEIYSFDGFFYQCFYEDQEGFKLVCSTSLVSAPGYSYIEYVLTRIVEVKEK